MYIDRSFFILDADRNVPSVYTAGKGEERDQALEICGLSLLDWELFTDDKRTHIVEGVVCEAVVSSLLCPNWTSPPMRKTSIWLILA